MTKVLMVASGKSATEIHDYDYKANGWTIVAINNGWAAAPELWDHWVRAGDFKGKRPENILPHQQECRRYGTALGAYGGQAACGYSITLNAGYWALHTLRPTVMGFLGADMNYTPSADGATHFYGVGWDIENNAGGIPDPDRMVNVYGKDNKETYLNDIYMRLNECAEKQACKVFNFSSIKDTRLPYTKAKPSAFE